MDADVNTNADIAGSKVALATETLRGTVRLATSTDTVAGLVVQANDTRLGGITSETDPQVGDNTLNRVPRWDGDELVSGNIYNDPAGNIGIGTEIPQARLDIRGQLLVDPGNVRTAHFSESALIEGGALSVMNNAGTGDSYIYIGKTTTTANYGGIGYDYSESKLKLFNFGDITFEQTGNVGIGTPAPAAKLDVNGHAIIRGGIANDATEIPYPILGGAWPWQFLALRYFGWTTLKPAGEGFRVTNHSGGLNNLILYNAPNINGYQLLLPNGKLLEGSDSRQKLNQETLDYGLAEVLRLEPKRYVRADSLVTLKTGKQESHEEQSGSEIGLIAQEVYEIVPEAVGRVMDQGREIWLLSYSSLVPVLVKAVQEQQEMIEKQKEINEAQGAKITSLEKRIATLEQK